ncbi:MAG TPA: BON domain-containing protein [Bryobacteraceae bacterium]|nr:BON domain-containing protein [Bryobacteraceae bacterium]
MRRLLAYVLACALLLGGTFTQTALLAGQAPMNHDDRISDQVRMRLATDADVKGGALEVTVSDGTVVIKGRVDTEKGKNKATKLAKKVKGVKTVDNQLAVGPPA